MFEKSLIVQLRCTMFVNQSITYNSENLSKVMESFPGFVPAFVISENQKGLLLSIENQPWKLVSADPSLEIIFSGNKIDVVHKLSEVFDEEKFESLVVESTKYLLQITDLFNISANRLALSPSYILKIEDLGSIQSFAKDVFAKNEFCGENIDTCNFNSVFRLNKDIGEMQNVKVNFLSKFEEGSIITHVENAPDNLLPCLGFTFDINTFPSSGITFGKAEINDFFEKSIPWNKEFASYYLS